jgi:hypothetical protein
MCAVTTRGKQIVRIQFGEICCALDCRDVDIFERLRDSFDIFLSDQPIDITLELNLVDRLDLETLATVPSHNISLPQETLQISRDHFYHVEFDAASRRFLAIAARGVFNTAFALRSLNKLLLLVYYTASRLKHPGRPPWMLVHSCGILHGGQVLLFAGPCETGKTTIGRLCGEDFGLPLNDEMMFVSWPCPEDHSLLAQSAPIFGELPFRTNTIAPLSSVLLLKQSRRTALRRLGRLEAYLRFLHQVVSPAGFNNHDTRTTISIMDSFADMVTRTTPFFELEFTRDRDVLWDVEAGLKDHIVRGAI